MTRVAVIDIGTVTARLAVSDVEDGRVTRLAKHSEIVNLGEGVDSTGRLADAAMARVFACVRGYAQSAHEAGAAAVVCTLTSAARDAQNSREFTSALESLGLAPQVIPGRVEGELTFLGVAQDFGDKRILVADNGGGSTELAMGKLGQGGLAMDFVRSEQVGCRRLTERFLSREDPPAQGDLAAAHEYAASVFGPTVVEGGLAAGGPNAPERLIVTGGTVTTLVAIDAALDPYDPSYVHLHELDRATVEALEHRLASMPMAERAKLPGIQAKRAPVILGGAVAVGELMRQTGFERLTVSESDLLFGLSIVATATLEGTTSPVGWKPQLRPVR